MLCSLWCVIVCLLFRLCLCAGARPRANVCGFAGWRAPKCSSLQHLRKHGNRGTQQWWWRRHIHRRDWIHAYGVLEAERNQPSQNTTTGCWVPDQIKQACLRCHKTMIAPICAFANLCSCHTASAPRRIKVSMCPHSV